jgi:hypothetical protein
MAADDVSVTNERVESTKQQSQPLIARFPQLVLATFYFVAGIILTIQLLSSDTVTTRRRVWLAGLVGLMFFLALARLMTLRLGLKFRKTSAARAPTFESASRDP